MGIRSVSIAWADHLARDLRFAARTLRRAPGFTSVTLTSLAIGFALTASTLAVINAYLLRTLPYPASDRLHHVSYAPPGPVEPRGMSELDWTSVSDVVEFPITATGETYYLTEGGYTQPARSLRVSRGFMAGLGVRTVIGRAFSERDFAAGSDRVALIGHSLWRERFGSDSRVVGRTFRAHPEVATGPTETFTIAGVLPPGFWYGRTSADRVDLLVPLPTTTRTYMVRLRAGVPIGVAEARITAAARSVATWLPDNWTGVHLESVHERYVAGLQPVLVAIMVAAGLVLVIVCVNVAVLMLLRSWRRQKEVGVRLALGAERTHVIRMLMVEGGLICFASLLLGLALTRFTLRLVAPLIETQLGRPAPGGTSAIALDPTVLWVMGATGLLIALGLAFIPLLTPWQRRLADTLRRSGVIGTDSRSMRRLRSGLIALEVAGSLALLVGSGLMIRSAVHMVSTDLGFRTDGVLRARVVLRGANYPDAAAFVTVYERLTERLTTLANSQVAFINWPPFNETPKLPVELDGGVEAGLSAGSIAVGAAYFDVLGVELKQGRAFTERDRPGTEPVAVVSETLAKALWPDGNAIGRQIRSVNPADGGNAPPAAWRTVVGVAADARQTYDDADLNDLYVPFLQASPERFASFYLRSNRPSADWFPALRAAVAEVDPNAILHEPQSLSSENRQLASTRFMTTLLTGFALFALLLASLGIYGVIAYGVQQREREVAIRIAIGATPGGVVRLFLKEGGLVVVSGIGLGLFGGAAVAKLLVNQIHGVRPFDLPTFVATGLLMAMAGLFATWWPARRAANRSPMLALKES